MAYPTLTVNSALIGAFESFVSSASITVPATTLASHTQVLVLAVRQQTGVITFSTTGWELAGSTLSTTTFGRLLVYKRTGVYASGTTTVNFATVSNGKMHALAVTGALDALTFNATVSSTSTATTPSVTATGAETVWAQIVATSQNPRIMTVPGDTTAITALGAPDYIVGLVIATKNVASGATGASGNWLLYDQASPGTLATERWMSASLALSVGGTALNGGGELPTTLSWDGKKLPDALAIAATAAANAAANGSKNAAYLTYLQGQIGSNYVLKLVRDDIVVWQATASGSLPISGSRFVLPTSVTQTSITSADIDTGQWVLRVEKAGTPATYIATLVTPLIGTGPFYLTADLDVGGTLTLDSLVFNSPSFDVATGDIFQTVALTDMRKSGWTGSYADSYATNDGTLWGRGGSSQSIKASLTMSRYPMKTTANTGPNGLQLIDAFVAARNPDYALELQDGVVGGWIGPQTQTGTVARLLLWNQIFLDSTLQFAHAPGYTGNSRVMMWAAEVWVKLSGTWTRLSPNPANTFSGESWSPRFNLFGGVGISGSGVISTEGNVAIYANNIDARIEATTGYMSARPAPYVAGTGQKPTPQDAPYWQFHGFAGGNNTITPANVQDILILHRTGLVLHNPAGTDDRDYARFLLACGADYYPAPGVTVDGNPNFVPGVGTSRHKYVRAKYPDWQWHVMHTMTEAEFNATNGYPPSLTNLVEGA